MAAYTTSVPSVTFASTGFQAPSEADILAGVIQDYQQAFSSVLNLSISVASSLTTPQGQLSSTETAIIGAVNSTFLYYCNQVDPAFATGRMQDAIGRIYFIERIPGQPTILQVLCTGLQGVIINAGATISDTSGNIYACLTHGVIPYTGSLTLSFACTVIGPTTIPSENNVQIYQSISGWDLAQCTSGVVGYQNETRSAFELRRAASVAGNSLGWIAAVRGAVLSVAGVADAYVTENVSSTSQTIGGVSLLPNSIYVAVTGGLSTAVAQAIWSKKGPGAQYNGNTSVTIQDTRAFYTPPYPTYTVFFEIPSSLSILFNVEIANTTLVPNNADALIQAAIVSAFAGDDGGAPAVIGATLYASRYYAPVINLGAWAQIITLQVGSNNVSSSVFVGSISGSTLTISSVTSGTITVGQTISDITGNLTIGTIIASGSGSSWTVSPVQQNAISSETMYGAIATNETVVVQINQQPTISAANIQVSFV